MGRLILASAFLILLHTLTETPLKARLIERCGKPLYHLLFSASALLGMAFLVLAWQNAPYLELWDSPRPLRLLALLLMPLAFYLFLAGLALPKEPDMEKAPVLLITREPLLWGVALWAVLHLLANGDLAAVIFFGTFLYLALLGMRVRERKRAGDPGWHELLHQTSSLPFVAVLKGRAQLRPGLFLRDPNLWLALLVYTIMLHLHPWLFGVRPW